MAVHTLSLETYRRKVLGCWLGKNVGGTLGQPHEGKPGPLSLTFYDPVPDGAIANDDLDLQLVWLAKLREVGPMITERDLGQAWRDSLTYPWDEYGLGKANLFLGIEPPVSGQHNNWFTDSMGAPIRSEIWACAAPGCPDLAAALAYQDGCVDHGGEGLFGEIFFAAMEAAAFVIEDRETLLDLGLSFLPPDCRTAKAIRICRERHAAGDDWLQCRQVILDQAGHVNFTDAPQNIAFSVLGWLYGEDAGDGMCKAVNCGQDTDCTGATLGAIYGLLYGPEYFDEKWTKPVGDEIKVGYGVINCEVPATLQELADWTEQAAREIMEAHNAPVRLGDADDLAGLTLDDLKGQALCSAKLENLDWKVTKIADKAKLVSDYGGEPTIAPGESLTVTLSATGDIPEGSELSVKAPEGWSVRPGASHRAPGLVRRPFTVAMPAGAGMAARYELQVSVSAAGSVLADDTLTVAGKQSWKITGPIPVSDLAAALDAEAPADGWRTVLTDGHALVLDPGLDFDRVYFLEAVVNNPEPQVGRIVCATQEMQRVALAGQEILRKTEPTRFVPAPHRSGAGTTYAMEQLPAKLPLTITLVARAGQQAEVHLFLTEPSGEEYLRRNCPIVGAFVTAP